MRSHVGMAWRASSTTAASRSTPMSWSAPSGRSPQSQERLVRRLRWRRRALGCHRLTDRNLQAVAMSNPTPISPTSSPRSSTAIPTAKSTISCRGPTQHYPRSKPWPENAGSAFSLQERDEFARPGRTPADDPTSNSIAASLLPCWARGNK
jgi:hypothetical protein